MIPFVYPTEILPTWLRAKGNAFGVAGWAVGFGGGSLLVPIMFAGINEKTYDVFGAALLIYIPIIYTFFPETAGRTLEEIDFLFANKSMVTWNEEEEFETRMTDSRGGFRMRNRCLVGDGRARALMLRIIDLVRLFRGGRAT